MILILISAMMALWREGTPYVWPGLQSDNGVLQAVLDGRSGTWWIGAFHTFHPITLILNCNTIFRSFLQATVSTVHPRSRGAQASTSTRATLFTSLLTLYAQFTLLLSIFLAGLIRVRLLCRMETCGPARSRAVIAPRVRRWTSPTIL